MIGRWAPPLLALIGFFGLWELLAQTGALADLLSIDEAAGSLLVPAPSEVAAALWTDRSLLIDNGWVTLREVVAGFALSVVLGGSFAAAMHLSPALSRALYPLLVASQTVPIVAIAPVLVIWLGFGIGPTLAIIALICFFPITVNTLDGLRSVDPGAIRMMRTLDAGRLTTLRRLEARAALPYFFSGAKIAVAVAVIGAVFGEWAGAGEGLGHLILVSQGQLLTDRVLAAVVVLSIFAIALFGALALLERRLAWWGRKS